MAIPKGIPSRSELQSLLVIKLYHIRTLPLKKPWCTRIKSAFFRFLERKIRDTIHKRILDTTLIDTIGRLSHSDAFLDVLAEKVHKHPALAQLSAESMSRTTNNKIEDKLKNEDEKLITSLPSNTKSSSKASKDSSMAWGDLRRRNRKKTMKIPRCQKGRKSKKMQSSSSSLTFTLNETEYNTPEDSSGSESLYRDHGRSHCTGLNGDSLQVIHRLDTCIRRAVDYKTYRPENKS